MGRWRCSVPGGAGHWRRKHTHQPDNKVELRFPYACDSSVNLQKPNVTDVTKYFYGRVTLIIKFQSIYRMFRVAYTDVKVYVQSSLAEQKQCNTNLASKLT